jgi:DNA polymerase-3 subunit delta'
VTDEATVWDQLVGHEEAARTLRDAIDSERVTHAWLFTGPLGVGKVDVARAFAAALNCETTTGSGADGTCATCRRILRGVHPDVHLVEPEGENLLVEDVRGIREEAWRSRQEGRTAVFIVDHADRMTEAGANALLKVLEEPPPDVVFVLVARSAASLVDTIPSRARAVSFADLPLHALAGGLSASLGVEPERAEWAAAAGHGRLERARELLTDAGARDRRERVLDLIERLATGQSGDALAAAATVVAVGDDASNAAKLRHAKELEEYERTFGKGRGSGAMRKRIEARHRRLLRRVRFEAIREAVTDLLAATRDIVRQGAGNHEGRLIHPDRAGVTGRLATKVTPAAALAAAQAFEEADRRLTIGAAPLLTCEAAFLAANGAFRGERLPLTRVDLRR